MANETNAGVVDDTSDLFAIPLLADGWYKAALSFAMVSSCLSVFGSVSIIVLALLFPIARLAAATSIVTLLVFAMVNLSLARIGKYHDDILLKRFRLWGYVGTAMSIGLILYNLQLDLLVSH